MFDESPAARAAETLLFLLLVPGVVIACGGDGTGPYGSEDTGGSEQASGSASSATTIEMTSASSGTYDGGTTSFEFSPEVDTVSVGDTVTWTNGSSGGVHTVDADDGSWGSGEVGGDESYSRVFTETGRHPYHCTYHGEPGSGMHGAIVVQ